MSKRCGESLARPREGCRSVIAVTRGRHRRRSASLWPTALSGAPVSDHAAVPPPHVPVHRVVADVTERVIARSRASRTAYLSRISQAAAERGGAPRAPTSAAATSPTPSPPAVAPTAPRWPADIGREPRDRHVLQRHALGARAVRALPAADQGRPPARSAAVARVAGGVPGDVRRHHPGPGGHGAQPVQPRRHRDVDGDRPVPRRVRRGPDARRLRQDRARPGGRCAGVRSPAHRPGAGRPDGLRPVQRREGRGPPGVRRRARSAARSCWPPRSRRTTRRAPAPSTAPPTPTSC